MPRLDSAKQCQQDGYKFRRVAMEKQGFFERYDCIKWVYASINYGSLYYQLCFMCNVHIQEDTVRDDIQMALHLMSSGNADKVPDNQHKEFRRRNLVKNV